MWRGAVWRGVAMEAKALKNGILLYYVAAPGVLSFTLALD